MKVVTAVMFAASSFVVTLANKSILTTYQFPSFKAMALIQSLTTVLALYALKKLRFVEFSDLKWGMLLSLSGTKELSIPMNTTIHRFAVMTTMILEYYVLSVWPPRSVQLSVMVMVLGAVIAMAEPSPNVFGYACVLISDAFSSYGCVFTKDILERDTSMNKYGFLFFNSLFVLPLMLLLACIDDDLVLAYNFPMWHDPFFSLMFVVASTLGALLSFTAMLCTLHNSALTTTIVACLKNAFVTYVGMYWGMRFGVFTMPSNQNGLSEWSNNWTEKSCSSDDDINSWHYWFFLVYRTFLETPARFLKLLLPVGTVVCQIWLMIDKMEYADVIVGYPFDFFFYTVSFSLMTSLFLLTSSVLSRRSFKSIQSSSFVLLFDVIASFLYICTSTNLFFSTRNFKKEYDLLDKTYLNPLIWDLYCLSAGGCVLAGLYLTDALIALKYKKVKVR
ncbi:unnamed protein product [Bemisia tabaci]|uniref:Uncharacterized protein n=2 Tax=Bemisia tabaci TaxID=7038 RepID=A0A9P0A580_BEMTA|nr:unnamed protein product [Bemisia tabaci]